MLGIVFVFLGGALGSVLRFWWSGLVARWFGETFPFGTLVVNVVASMVIGLLSCVLLHLGDAHLTTLLQQLLSVGICGGLSTFSSFSLQTWNLFIEGRWLAALMNIFLSTAACFGCVALGWQITSGAHF